MARDTSAGVGSGGVADPAVDEDIARHFERFAATARRDGALLYAEICAAVAHDPTVLALMAEVPPGPRRVALLLLAAVHDLLLGGAEDALAADYPTVQALRSGVAWRQGPEASSRRAETPRPGVAGRFVAFCARHRQALGDLVATRSTQTNEVGRGAVLLPALASIAGEGPLALFDLGASAGLNLLFDRWHYRFVRSGAADPTVIEAGDPTSPVIVACELRGAHLPPLAAPPLAWRAGLDLCPLDPGSAEDRRWLLACQWPHDVARFARLHAALSVAAADPSRPPVRRGDMVEDLAALVDTAPPGTTPCLFHSWVAAYLSVPEQRRLVDAVGALARRRPLLWLFAESPDDVPGLPIPPAPPAGRRGATALVAVLADGDALVARRLADLHPHGRWLRWWGPEAPDERR